MRFAYILIASALALAEARAQNAPPRPTAFVATRSDVKKEPKKERPSFIPVPIVFSQPETGLAGGAALLPVWRFGPDTTVRKSSARLVGWVSQKNQSLLQLTYSMFTAAERYLVTGEATAYYRFPINYYGYGPRTRTQDRSVIQYKILVFNERVLRKITGNLFVGLQHRLTRMSNVQVRQNIDANTPSLLYERNPREYTRNTLVSGVGPSALYDSRDNTLSAYTGNYLEVSALFNGRALGSDYRFSRYLLDARHYIPLDGSCRTILATQLVGQFHTGDVPFRELANLGGDKILRGYYEGRYRDRQLLALQAEVRRYLFWRLNGAVFGGVGQVGNSLAKFNQGGLKATSGVGVRFAFSRRDRLNVRFDYGVGRGGSSGFYFSIGEAI